jgi:hypothetical protein
MDKYNKQRTGILDKPGTLLCILVKSAIRYCMKKQGRTAVVKLPVQERRYLDGIELS